MMNCPCQSGNRLDACCGRFISHHALPGNALQLMRSRYTAFVMGDADYLMTTWQQQFRPASLQLDPNQRWLGLKIFEFTEQPERASVEFEARYLLEGLVRGLHEKSRFVLQQGQWLYSEGEQLAPTFNVWKPGRNEPCPCGSGKKFKRCCAV